MYVDWLFLLVKGLRDLLGGIIIQINNNKKTIPIKEWFFYNDNLL